MRTLIAMMLVLTATAAGCGLAAVSHQPPGGSSGIQGTITVDAGCPQVTSTPCPRRPLQARLLIRPARPGAPAISAESDADGHYRVVLPPGRYTIQPRNTTGAFLPRAFPLQVTVHPGSWTTLPIDFDSGVR